MITTKLGETKMKGSGLELRVDLACIVKAFKETLGEEETRKAVDLGLMPEKERHALFAEKLRSELPGLLKDLVKEILGPDEDGKDEAE